MNAVGLDMSIDAASLVDAVIAFTLVEVAALLAWHRVTGRGIPLADFGWTIAAGLFLMIALRCVTTDAGAGWVALSLLAAGLSHSVDLLVRSRRARRSTWPPLSGRMKGALR